jgi:hypothetical protein
VSVFLKESGFTDDFVNAIVGADWNGMKLLTATRDDLSSVIPDLEEDIYDKFASEVFNLLSRFGTKYVVLWSFDGNQFEKLSVTAGSTVYGVDEIDDEWIRVRDQRGGVGRVPLRYMQIVEKVDKGATGGTKPTRSLSRNRSMKNTFAMKEKVKPNEWEAKDVAGWLGDIGIPRCHIHAFEGITGKELLELTVEKLRDELNIGDEDVLSMLERGVKLLKTDHVPRNTRQVKSYLIWTGDDVISWLIENGCSAYVSKFKELSIKGKDLAGLEKEKLTEMGLDDVGSTLLARKIVKLVQDN